MTQPKPNQRGFTMIETMIAMVVLAISAIGLLALFGVAISVNTNQGDHGPRTTELAQAKMEQLLALSFSDAATNTTVSPTVSTGGSGLAAGGSVSTAAPVTLYVDYLDSNGNYGTTLNPVTAANAYYIRQWQIVNDPTGEFKTITVLARCAALSKSGATPSTTVASIKANL